MCEICRQTPCHNMCPNAEPPEVVGHCKNCTDELTADETYFTDSESNAFCSEECALKFYGVHEEDFNVE